MSKGNIASLTPPPPTKTIKSKISIDTSGNISYDVKSASCEYNDNIHNAFKIEMSANQYDVDVGSSSMIIENDDGSNEHTIIIPIYRSTYTEYDQTVGAFMIKYIVLASASSNKGSIILNSITARKNSTSSINAFARSSYDLMVSITPVKI